MITASVGPRGLRIRLRSRWRFFAAALFFSTAAITVSRPPLHVMYHLRRASMYAVFVAFCGKRGKIHPPGPLLAPRTRREPGGLRRAAQDRSS